jgi:CBS domain-containing protein
MRARELMTADPTCCTPEDTIEQVAQLMRDHDCGCIPVVEDKQSKRLVGVVTDRDIAIRCTAEGKGPQTRVKDALSPNAKSCGPDDDVEEVERIMTGEQVRRVPVVDQRGSCVGMIAQADLARNHRAASDSQVGKVVERISEPALAPS